MAAEEEDDGDNNDNGVAPGPEGSVLASVVLPTRSSVPVALLAKGCSWRCAGKKQKKALRKLIGPAIKFEKDFCGGELERKCNEAVTVMNSEARNPEESFRIAAWEKADGMFGQAIRAILDHLENLGLAETVDGQLRPKVFFPMFLNILINRAGVRNNLGKYRGALDDADVGLELIRDQREKGQQDNDWVPHDCVDLLWQRGGSLNGLGEYKAAAADFRACYAAIRVLGKEWNEEPTAECVRREILEAMLQHKLASGAQRPFFSPDERDKLLKELNLSIYSDAAYQCAACGKKGSLAVNLYPCSRCRRVLYCGRACQVKAWKMGGHKQECPHQEKPLAILPISQKSSIDKSIKKKGWDMIGHAHRHLDLVLFDEETETYYQFLTDHDSTFCPDEVVLAKISSSSKPIESKRNSN